MLPLEFHQQFESMFVSECIEYLPYDKQKSHQMCETFPLNGTFPCEQHWETANELPQKQYLNHQPTTQEDEFA